MRSEPPQQQADGAKGKGQISEQVPSTGLRVPVALPLVAKGFLVIVYDVLGVRDPRTEAALGIISVIVFPPAGCIAICVGTVPVHPPFSSPTASLGGG
jgi:hypothetical protein